MTLRIPFPDSGWTLALSKSINPSHINVALYWTDKGVPTHSASALTNDVVSLLCDDNTTGIPPWVRK